MIKASDKFREKLRRTLKATAGVLFVYIGKI